jgi:uncharacterized membrane protein
MALRILILLQLVISLIIAA